MAVNGIALAIKEGLSLWKKYIETRQGAYIRKMDKRKMKAIDAAEKYILFVEPIVRTHGTDKDIRAIRKWKRRFFDNN